ncbi:MAG: hypothetical protein WCY37_03145 [Candidatus Dojkabacteria bacterium]
MFKKVFKTLLILFLFAIITLTVIGFVSYLRYSKWKEEELSKQEILCSLDIQGESSAVGDLSLIIEEKIKKFALSDTKTDFIVLTEEEMLYLFLENFTEEGDIRVEDICLKPSEGVWQLYLKGKYKKISVPWLVLDIVKDNLETAEVYVREVRVGDLELPAPLETRLREDLNRGISDGIIMLNENNFLGRRIDNIELLEDRVVFKGTR